MSILTPIVLQRLSTEYCASEDRVRLAGEPADAAPVVIWLTRRLLDRLLPALLAWLEKGQGRAASTSDSAIRQGFAQQAARAQLTPQAPVRATPASAAWLAQTVDVRETSRNVTLTFRGGDDQAATVTLTARPLRQWLDIMHDAYRKAGWPLAIWPHWLRDSDAPVDRSAVVMH